MGTGSGRIAYAAANQNRKQTVLLEMVNFHNYGDFQGVLVRKIYGEFTMDIMVNFALIRIYSKFHIKCLISDYTTHFWSKLPIWKLTS